MSLVCPQCEHTCDDADKFCPSCGFPIAELVQDEDDPLIGTTLPGGYVILELVGVGGMGRVYRAEQKALGRTVAVKIIHPHLLGDESASVRFITEARASSRLNHPNSVGVIDFGKNGDQLYLVMEFLRGHDLARILYEEGLLPFRRIIDVLCQVLAALDEAHHLGIIHRDLKPENIVLEPMRTGGDFVKVVDFGLAKMRAEAQGTNITSPGIVCGTPDYMAPEQGRGDPIDARSDLYACGVILFQLLTGRLPFEAESPTQVVLMHLSVPPPNPAKIAPDRDIPESLIEVCLRALSKDADKRYQSADEFAAALRNALATFDAASGHHTFEPPSGRVSWLDSIECKACGASVPRGQKFCGECGARVEQDSDPGPRPVSKSPTKRERISSLPSLPLPFSARTADLDFLEASRFEVESSFGAVRVIGENGAGKSRLLEEFLAVAEAAGDRIIQCGPDPWWAEVGYFALRQAITALADLPADGGAPRQWAGASPEANRGLMEVFGRTSAPQNGAQPAAWLDVQGDGLTVEERRFVVAESLRWAMSQAHHREGGRRIVLAIDDLHAVDGASRNAFADVVADAPSAPILMIATHTPTFDASWPNTAAKSIEGLPTTVAASLIRGASASEPPPDDDGRRVLPLYIDQLVRFSLEGGSNPPARLGDLIALRIERLPPDARRTLQAVAVLGDATEPSVLPELVPGMSSLDEVLGVLGAAGFIQESVKAVKAAHPLIRDVVLAMIPAGVRRELHSQAAELGVATLPVEVQGLHAYHAQNAFEALMLLETVASKTALRGDRAGSVLALRRGLDLARREMFRGEIDDPMRAVLIFSRKLGDALASAGKLQDADGVLREALDLAGPSGVDRVYVLGSLALIAKRRDRRSEAKNFIREAVEMAKLSSRPDLVTSLEKMKSDLSA